MTAAGAPARFFRDLPLFAKLLVPFVVLMVLLGAVGGFLVVHDLSSRGSNALDADLTGRSLAARSLVRDRELSLIESVNFAANVQGMTAAVRKGDAKRATTLLGSVVALNPGLDLLAVAGTDGHEVAGFGRSASTGAIEPSAAPVRLWSPSVRDALASSSGTKSAGLAAVGGRTLITVAGAICSQARPCSSVGVAVAGVDIGSLASDAAAKTRSGVAFYGPSGAEMASAGMTAAAIPAAALAGDAVRRSGAKGTATIFAPLVLQGTRAGTLAVTISTAPAFASVRGAGLRLTLVLLAGLAGIIVIGAVVSRLLLAQVRPLVATNKALASGDLTARTPVLSNDELGQLAAGVNQMAAQLEASVDTLEQRVEERTEEVRRLLRERTEFFASLSHEFRTPLAVILRQADLLLDPRTPKTRRWAEDSGHTLKESGQQLLFVINDILELAKAEVGGLEVTLERVRMAEVVEDTRRTIEGLAQDAGLTVKVRVPKNLPAVRADRARLREVILNLVDNAVKYTPDGGRVEVTARARNRHVEVSVSDTGVGIPAEAQERIFEPFYRVKGTKTQRRQSATGLGLALTKRLVEAQNGDISVESAPGAGSTFTFTLPLAKRS